MDAKDFRLLVVLNENARQSFQALGRRITLSAPAVRDRLRRLEQRGIVQGYWVSIDPAIFGRQNLLVYFDPEWTRPDTLRALDAPDVAWVAWKVDGGLTLQVWPADAKKAVATLAEFLAREPSWHAASRPGWMGNMTGLDWRVLDVLIDQPLASIEALALETGLSPKTVRKHLNGLVGSEAIFVVPRIGLPIDSGVLVYNLVVSGRAPFPDLRRVVGDSVLIHETDEPSRQYLFCRANNLAELTTSIRALEKVPGVSSVEVSLNREMIFGTPFVHRLIRERIGKRRQPSL